MDPKQKLQHVPLEIAMLLKEKGSDIKCSAYYDANTNGLVDLFPKYSNDSMERHLYINFKVVAPEIAQVIEWLRKNHGIWVHVEPTLDGDEWYPKITICSEKTWRNFAIKDALYFCKMNLRINLFKTPMEAYIEALRLILTKAIK